MTHVKEFEEIRTVLAQDATKNSFNKAVAGNPDENISESQKKMNTAIINAIQTGVLPEQATHKKGTQSKISTLLKNYSENLSKETTTYLANLLHDAQEGWDNPDATDNDEGDYSVDIPIIEKLGSISDNTAHVIENLHPEKPIQAIRDNTKKAVGQSKNAYITSLSNGKIFVLKEVGRSQRILRAVVKTVKSEWKNTETV